LEKELELKNCKKKRKGKANLNTNKKINPKNKLAHSKKRGTL